MAKYHIELNKHASKVLGKIRKGDKKAADKIDEVIESLKKNPRPNDCKPLSGKFKNIWSIRAGIHYRVCYEIHDSKMHVYVLALGPRETVYEALGKVR